MIVSVFNEHKACALLEEQPGVRRVLQLQELLNHFFLSMGDKEFRFIERFRLSRFLEPRRHGCVERMGAV